VRVASIVFPSTADIACQPDIGEDVAGIGIDRQRCRRPLGLSKQETGLIRGTQDRFGLIGQERISGIDIFEDGTGSA